MKNIIYTSVFIIVCFFTLSLYRILTFNMFEGIQANKIIIVEKEEANYIGRLFYFERGAVGVGKSPTFLTIEDKTIKKNYDILSSDHIEEIYWLNQDTLKVFLKENLFKKMKDFKNTKVVIILSIESNY